MYSLVVQSSGSQPGGRDPSKGHKINLRGCEMINGRGKKKKQSSATQICIILGDFTQFFANFPRKITSGAQLGF